MKSGTVVLTGLNTWSGATTIGSNSFLNTQVSTFGSALTGGNLVLRDAGTIRKEFASSIGENSVHGSDAPETAAQEIAYWFAETEIVG